MKYLMLLIALFFALTIKATEADLLKINLFDKNLLDAKLPFSDPMFTFNRYKMTQDDSITINSGIIDIKAKKDGASTVFTYKNWNWSSTGYSADYFGPMSYKLSFEAKLLNGGNGQVEIIRKPMLFDGADPGCRWGLRKRIEKQLKKRNMNPLRFKLKPTDDWAKYSWDFYTPNWNVMTFEVAGKNAQLQLRNLSLIPTYKSQAKDKISISSGKINIPCSGIYLKGDYPNNHDFEIEAAMSLNKYLALASGEILPVYKMSGNSLKPGGIYLGKAALACGLINNKELDAIGSGGFVIKSKDGNVAIVGKDSEGLLAGITCFLEKIGFDFLPLKIPTSSNRIAIPEISLSKTPMFEHIIFLWQNHTIDRSKLDGGARRLGGFGSGGHDTVWYVNHSQHIKKHPEYFSRESNGKLFEVNLKNPKSGRMHICMSNDSTLPIFIDAMEDLMNLQPEAKYFAVAQGDNQRIWCQCEKCKSKTPSEVNFSYVDRVASSIAKSHPDKIICAYAYQLTLPPPKEKMISENIRIWVCSLKYQEYNLFPNRYDYNCKDNQKGLDYLKKWTKQYPGQIWLWCYPSSTQHPYRAYNHLYYHIDAIRAGKKLGVNGIYCDGIPEFYKALFCDVLNKLVWDVNINVDKTIDDFMAKYYGSAASEMRGIFDRHNAQVKKNDIKERNYRDRAYGQKARYASGDFPKKIYDLFKLAEKSAGKNSEYLQRIEKDKFCFLFTDLYENNPANKRVLENNMADYALKLAEFAGLIKKYNIASLGAIPKVSWQDWFFETSGLDFTDFSDPKFKQFLKAPLHSLKNKDTGQKKIKHGWFMPVKYLLGGDRRHVVKSKYKIAVIRRPVSGQHMLKTILKLDKTPEGRMFLEIRGRDDEKNGRADFEIIINGKRIFSGKNKFPENGLDWVKYEIEKGILVKGENEIKIINTTKEEPGVPEKDPFYCDKNRATYYWGWIMISGVKVHSFVKENK